jgi:hypothetical protein
MSAARRAYRVRTLCAAPTSGPSSQAAARRAPSACAALASTRTDGTLLQHGRTRCGPARTAGSAARSASSCRSPDRGSSAAHSVRSWRTPSTRRATSHASRPSQSSSSATQTRVVPVLSSTGSRRCSHRTMVACHVARRRTARMARGCPRAGLGAAPMSRPPRVLERCARVRVRVLVLVGRGAWRHRAVSCHWWTEASAARMEAPVARTEATVRRRAGPARRRAGTARRSGWRAGAVRRCAVTRGGTRAAPACV